MSATGTALAYDDDFIVDDRPLDAELAEWVRLATVELARKSTLDDAEAARAELERDLPHWKTALVFILQGVEAQQSAKKRDVSSAKREAYSRHDKLRGQALIHSAETDYRDWLARSMGFKRVVVERLQHVKTLINDEFVDRAAETAAATERRRAENTERARAAAGSTLDDRVGLAYRLCGAVLRELGLDADLLITPRDGG